MPPSPNHLFVVMGVSGCGKSSVGVALAARLGVPFKDGDDLHPVANLVKMVAGNPLTDEDRSPWLELIGGALAAAPGGLVIACSALKRSYREAILSAAPGTRFIFLDVSRELLLARVSSRAGHFMPSSLLDSQLATLEPLGDLEPGVTVSLDANPSVDEIVESLI